MKSIKNFFKAVWEYLTFPYNWLTTRKIDKKLRKIAEEDRKSLITEKDVEFLKSIGVETDLKTLRNGGKK